MVAGAVVVTDDTTRAELEALTRRCMAELAQMPPARGFDSRHLRTKALARIDDLLDDWQTRT